MIGLRRISEFSSQQSNDSSNLIMITSRSKLLHNPLDLIPQQFPHISPNFQQLTKKKQKITMNKPRGQHFCVFRKAYRRGYGARRPA